MIDPVLRDRLVALPLLLVSVCVMLVAYSLTPDASGVGTHEQLGLPECGFKAVLGIPCATCGMTTAFSHAAHGRLWQSFITQPAGALLSLATAMLVIVSGYALWAGVSLAPLGHALTRLRVVIPVILIFVASWAYTMISHVFVIRGG